MDELPCPYIQPHESQARDGSGQCDTEGDGDLMATSRLHESRSQERHGHQPEIDELETLAGMQREPVPRITLRERAFVGIVHSRTLPASVPLYSNIGWSMACRSPYFVSVGEDAPHRGHDDV